MNRCDRGGLGACGRSLVVVILAVAVGAGCRSEIQHGLDEAEANEILVLLEANGIAGSKEQERRTGDWVISVPATEASRSWQILRAYGLPRRPVNDFAAAFGEPGLIPSPNEERVRIQQATAGQLESSLMVMDGVLDARVHLVFSEEETELGRHAALRATGAAVLIVYRPGEAGADPVDVGAIQRLTAGALPGIEAADVEVVTTPQRASVIAPPASLVRIGPISVSPESQGPLRWVLSGLSGLVLLLSATLVFVLVRHRRLRRLGEGRPVEHAAR